MNALFASAFTFDASCLSASVISSKLNFDSAGEGGREVAAVESLGDGGKEEESLIWQDSQIDAPESTVHGR